MKSTRSAGIILHPTSLPGPDGIGDLGPEAYQWVRFLKKSGCNLWQVLPLGPTGYGDSPYQAFSAFAGNPYLISPALLLDDGLITGEDLADRPVFPAGNVDFGPVIQWKLTLLERAYTRFQNNAAPELQAAISEFQASQASWLNDYALFMAIKEAQGGVSWDSWPEALRNREPAALQDFVQKHPEATRRHIFRQFLFFKQWLQLKALPMKTACALSAISRSLSLMTVPRYGRSLSCFTWMTKASQLWSPVFRPITSRLPGSCGATRSTGGMYTLKQVTPGGLSVCVPCSTWSISSASTTSVGLPAIGK
jgi:4-alpha-glucanotransferase